MHARLDTGNKQPVVLLLPHLHGCSRHAENRVHVAQAFINLNMNSWSRLHCLLWRHSSNIPDAQSDGIGLLVQAAMVQLHGLVIQVHAVDQLAVLTALLLRSKFKQG